MAETIYDVAILGGGPAGYTAAIRAGQYGLKVALIEKDSRLGGTCLLVGCIPTKALLFNAEIYDHFKHAKEYGLDGLGEATINWKAIHRPQERYRRQARQGPRFPDAQEQGHGRPRASAASPVQRKTASTPSKFSRTTKTRASPASSRRRTSFSLPAPTPACCPASKSATASSPTSKSSRSTSIPKSLLIIGAGAVGVEFGSIFRSFGSEISILEYLPRLVPVEDEEISKELARSFRKRGIESATGAKVEKVENTKDGVKVTYTGSDGKQATKEAEKVLVAVGRGPRTEGIGLEKTKITPERGFIKVNEYMQTDEPGIYAIGDIVAGMPQLAHSGSMAGLVAVAKIAGKYARPIKRERIPGCTYTEPQIGSVGLTEAKAKELGHTVKVGKFPFVGNSKATIVDSHDGFVKVVADAKYGEILGVHIIGPQATELIAEAVTAMELEATVEDMMWTIHAHPTLAEAMLDGFSSVEGMAINV